jgi:hypothetical protein
MAKIKVDFTLTKPAGSRLIMAIDPEGAAGEVNLQFDANGKASKMLEADSYFAMLWHFIGDHDNAMKVAWSAKGLSGTAAEDKIDRDQDRQYPGGKFWSSGASALHTPRTS